MGNDIEELKQLILLHLEQYEKDRNYFFETQDKNQKAYETNANNIEKLVEITDELSKATQGVVQAWETANALQRFLKWASSFAVIGVIVAWLWDQLLTYFK